MSYLKPNHLALRAPACAALALAAAMHCGAMPLAHTPALPSQARVQEQLSTLTVPFEANKGQFDARVAFAARTFTGSLFVTRDGLIVHSLLGQARGSKNNAPGNRHARRADSVERGPGWSLVEAPVRAQPTQPSGGAPAPVTVSRFAGGDAARWQTRIDTYQRVEMGEVWPGVTLSLAARGANVEKIFTLASNIKAERIAMRVEGASLSVTPDGSLMAHTGNGPVTFTPPVAWQILEAGEQVPVEVSYRLVGGSVYGFALGASDPAYPVVIDPLVQATYLGGSGTDDARAMAVDASGNVLVTGYTQSADFPGTTGGYHTGGGGVDAFVARLNGGLTSLMQAAYFGGSGSDIATSMRIDASGNVFVAGYTYSSDFPTTVGAAQTAKSGDATTPDAFIARFNSALSSLDRGTYLGGSGIDAINALVIDGTAIIVAGQTTSAAFPGTSGATQASIGGLRDAFLARLTGDLAMTRATYLGGSGEDEALSLAISGSNLYVAGYTSSTNFPAGTTSAGVFTANAGGIDGFAARFTSSLLTRSRTTYLGGAAEDMALAIAVDTAATPNVVVAGYTESANFPAGTSGTGAQTAGGGGTDAFVARFNDTLTSMFRSTYLGGGSTDVATAVMVHPSGDIYVTGYTSSDDSPGPPFPGVKSAASCTAPCVVPGAGSGVQSDSAGSMDAFVTRFNTTLSAHTQSTYLGGSLGDAAYAIAAASTPASPGNNVLIAGYTGSTNFRGTAGGAQPAYGGKGDVFVALLSLGLQDAAGDQKPGTFKLVDQVNVPPSSVITSAPVQITGITVATPVSVTGGEYCISATNSCASCTFGTASGMVNNNEYVCVRHTSAAGNNAITRTVLTVYGDSSTFSSTTSPVTPDTNADTFTFGVRPNVLPATQITSAPVQITGINLPAPIAIAGSGNPQYCISSASDPVTPCSCDVRAYGSTAATISAGQFVCVRHDAAGTAATQTVSTLAVGTTQGTLTSTTLAAGADTDPAPFSFVNQSNVPLMVAVTSAPVQITGIDTPAPISVTGGQYCISSNSDCSCNVRFYSTIASVISAGQHVCVKHTTPGNGTTVTSTTVTVGSVSGTFSSTTGASDATPDAFGFAGQTGVPLNAPIISAPTQITGLNTQVLATISGSGSPQYCLSSGNDCACDLQQFTTSSAPVTNGRFVCVRHTSAGTNGASVASTLSIGGVDGVFTSTTQLAGITLTAAKSGTGLGTVTSSPPGISCGADCDESYASGTAVTLTATPNPGSEFTGWSGISCNGGNASPTCTFTLTAPVTATAALLRDNPAVPDFNADTRPDILWRHTPSGALYVWYMNGVTLTSDQLVTTVDPSWKLDGVADFNGDGHPDIVWRNGAGDTYVWYLVNGVFQSDAFLFSLPPEWVIQGVADFNADGKPDFLMRNTNSGNAFAWFFNNNVAIGDQFLFNIDPSWKVEGVADLNADGQPDLLFRNVNSGLAFAWNSQFSAGTLSLATSSPPIFSIDSFWEVVQIADWNNDGKPDLLFRNKNTGVVFVWYLDGVTLTTSDFIIQIDPVWEIVPKR